MWNTLLSLDLCVKWKRGSFGCVLSSETRGSDLVSWSLLLKKLWLITLILFHWASLCLGIPTLVSFKQFLKPSFFLRFYKGHFSCLCNSKITHPLFKTLYTSYLIGNLPAIASHLRVNSIYFQALKLKVLPSPLQDSAQCLLPGVMFGLWTPRSQPKMGWLVLQVRTTLHTASTAWGWDPDWGLSSRHGEACCWESESRKSWNFNRGSQRWQSGVEYWLRASDEPFFWLFDTLLGSPPPSPVGHFILHWGSLGDMDGFHYSLFVLILNKI